MLSNLRVLVSEVGHMLLVRYVSSVRCLFISFAYFSGKRNPDGRKIYGNFFIVLVMAWVPDTLLKQFESVTGEKQEISQRNEQK